MKLVKVYDKAFKHNTYINIDYVTYIDYSNNEYLIAVTDKPTYVTVSKEDFNKVLKASFIKENKDGKKKIKNTKSK